MRLYHVQYDHQSYWIEAESLPAAVEAWRAHVAAEWGDDYKDTDEPESIHLVHEDAVIRLVADSEVLFGGGMAITYWTGRAKSAEMALKPHRCTRMVGSGGCSCLTCAHFAKFVDGPEAVPPPSTPGASS